MGRDGRLRRRKGWKKGDYKNLNIPFENKLLAQPAEIRERMAERVEDFAYKMMTEVFNAQDTAPLGVEAILAAGSYDLKPKVGRIDDPEDWTNAKIIEGAKSLDTDKGAKGSSTTDPPSAPGSTREWPTFSFANHPLRVRTLARSARRVPSRETTPRPEEAVMNLDFRSEQALAGARAFQAGGSPPSAATRDPLPTSQTRPSYRRCMFRRSSSASSPA